MAEACAGCRRLVDEVGGDALFVGISGGAGESVSHAVVEVVTAIDGADDGAGIAAVWCRFLEVPRAGSALLATEVVGCGVVVPDDDVVVEVEGGSAASVAVCSLNAWGIPAGDIEDGRRVGHDGVVGDGDCAVLAEVEGDGIFGAAEVGEVGVVSARRTGDRVSHSDAVADGDVVGHDGGAEVATDLEGASVVGVGDGVGDAEGVRSAGVDVAKIKPILSVVDELGVVDGGGDAGAVRCADAVSVAAGALAVAGGDRDGVNSGILLVASAPLDGGVEELPVAVDAGSGVTVVEVPACAAVEGYVASLAGDQAADGSLDAAADVAVDPHVLHEQVMGGVVGVDAIGVVVVC